MKISCVVPAYNEEENLEKLVEKLIPALESHEETKDYEIILVNDNSIDDTPSIIDALASENPRIKPVHRVGIPGFGNAIKSGFKHAEGDVIIPVMGDSSDDPKDIPKLVKKIEEGYDIAYGSRFIKGGSVEDYPRFKKCANRIFNNTVRFLFGISYKDITNTFKAYKREVFEEIGIENIEAEGFDLTIELPLKAHMLSFKSAEVPVTWHGRGRGEPKLKLSENALVYGKRLLKLFLWANVIALRDLFGAVFRGSWMRLAAAAIFGLVILVCLFFLSGFSQIFNALENISSIYILASCAMVLSAFLFRTGVWDVLLRASGHTVSRRSLFRCIMFGWFISFLIPARIGDFARGVALKTTEGTPLGIGLSTIVLERVLDLIAIAIILAVVTTFLGSDQFMMLWVIAIALAVMLVLLLFAFYKFDRFVIRIFSTRFPKIKDFMGALKDGLREIYNNPMAMGLALLLSIPVWLLEISSIYFASKAIHFNLSFPFAGVSGIASFIAQTVPLTPAGIGIHEGTIAGVLALFGIPMSVGTAIALVDHFARGAVICSLGMMSAIHIGFASREYFAKRRNLDGEN